MKNGKKQSKIDGKELLKRSSAVIIAGLVSGFFGAGGGAVLIMLWGKGAEAQRDIFARTAVLTAAFSVISALGYQRSGDLPTGELPSLIIPALAGGVTGAVLLDRIKGNALKVIFGAISAIGGLIMLIR